MVRLVYGVVTPTRWTTKGFVPPTCLGVTWPNYDFRGLGSENFVREHSLEMVESERERKEEEKRKREKERERERERERKRGGETERKSERK